MVRRLFLRLLRRIRHAVYIWLWRNRIEAEASLAPGAWLRALRRYRRTVDTSRLGARTRAVIRADFYLTTASVLFSLFGAVAALCEKVYSLAVLFHHRARLAVEDICQ